MPAVAGTGDVYGHAVGASGGDISGTDAASAASTCGVMVDGSGAGGEFDIKHVAAGAGQASSGADRAGIGSVLAGRAARPAADEHDAERFPVEVGGGFPVAGVGEDGYGVVGGPSLGRVVADNGGGRAVKGRNGAG